METKIEGIEQEIDELPVVQQFKQSQVEVNDLLQLVSSAIANTVTNEVIASTDGDLLKGETGSKVRNSVPGSCS